LRRVLERRDRRSVARESRALDVEIDCPVSTGSTAELCPHAGHRQSILETSSPVELVSCHAFASFEVRRPDQTTVDFAHSAMPVPPPTYQALDASPKPPPRPMFSPSAPASPSESSAGSHREHEPFAPETRLEKIEIVGHARPILHHVDAALPFALQAGHAHPIATSARPARAATERIACAAASIHASAAAHSALVGTGVRRSNSAS
jgi:hypothetical protein